jgi:hypothetical protein
MNTPEDFLKGINIKDRTIRVLTFSDKNYMLTDLMLDYAKVYSESLVAKVDISDVVGRSEQLVCNSYYANNLSMQKECLNCGKLSTEH